MTEPKLIKAGDNYQELKQVFDLYNVSQQREILEWLFDLYDVRQQRELLEWLSNEPVFNIPKDEISEILEDWEMYNSNCV